MSLLFVLKESLSKPESLSIVYKDSCFDDDSFRTKLKDIALSGYQNYSPSNFLLTREDYQLLKDLRDNRKDLLWLEQL